MLFFPKVAVPCRSKIAERTMIWIAKNIPCVSTLLTVHNQTTGYSVYKLIPLYDTDFVVVVAKLNVSFDCIFLLF